MEGFALSKAGKGSRGFTAIAGVLLLAAGLRGAILFAGQRGLRSDEAVVGLMAKHIFTRGETPVFLYGQAYGGGHAMAAYLAAPLFALFGSSEILLTGISVVLSLVSVWLVWLIVRRHVGEAAAILAAALYAFSPPVVYQSYLVNGGTEAFLLALLALHFFLRSYAGEGPDPRGQFLAGIFGGLAYWAMDYTLLYPVVFALLWLARGPLGFSQARPEGTRMGGSAERWRALARLAGGFLVGCLPLLAYNARHDFEHFREMYAPAAGASAGFLEHFFGALWRVFSGDLAAFFGGDIDDVHPAGPAAWIHAVVAVLAVAILIYRNRAAIALFPKSRRVPATLLPAVFVIVYLGMYGVAKFSLPELRTPRYLLPLCPFVSIAIAIVVAGWAGARRWAGLAVIALLVGAGASASLQIGMRPWHEEHLVRTSGAEIAKLAAAVEERDIRVAFAPYEIQWRLMFATDERVVATSLWISPGPSLDRPSRYQPYDDAVWKTVGEGTPFAFIFRRDFAFAEWAARGRIGGITRDVWRDACRRAGISPAEIPVGEEFVIFYPLRTPFLRALWQAKLASARPPAASADSGR
jgi:4-amino-4-deoxy-L-arabinose transferase-like glycosyltransferase